MLQQPQAQCWLQSKTCFQQRFYGYQLFCIEQVTSFKMVVEISKNLAIRVSGKYNMTIRQQFQKKVNYICNKQRAYHNTTEYVNNVNQIPE